MSSFTTKYRNGFCALMVVSVSAGCTSESSNSVNSPSSSTKTTNRIGDNTADARPVMRLAAGNSQLAGQTITGWIPAVDARKWQHIVIHHTAAETGSVESIHRIHRQRKDSKGRPWRGIGYHFVIGNGKGMRDGMVEPTFRWTKQLSGAHAGIKKYNESGVGICLVGNFEKQPPTDAQLKSARRLISFLRKRYNIAADQIIGHGEIKNTACPGRYFSLAKVTQEANTPLSDLQSQESLDTAIAETKE